MKELIIGGARSGKSAHAEKRAVESGLHVVYIATAQVLDGEMERRVALHRVRRPVEWGLVESPLGLFEALAQHAAPDTCLLVDCLTLWLTNLMLEERDIPQEFASLLLAVKDAPGRLVFVSNEVGLGIVPENRMAREVRDHAGRLHQQVAALVPNVYFIAAGLPLKMKG